MKCYCTITLFGLLLSLMSFAVCAQSTDSIRAVISLEKAKSLYLQYKYEESLVWYAKTIELQKKAFGEESLPVAKTYNNMGICWDGLGEYDKAIENHQKALKIKLKVVGEMSATTSSSYKNMGVSYRHKNYLNKALAHYQKALEIRLVLYEPDHLQVANIYESMAICHELKGDYDRAITYYEKSLPIQLKQLDELDPEIGMSYNNIGGCLIAQDKFSEGLNFYNKALAIYKKQAILPLLLIADLYESMGVAYQENNQFDQALEMQLKCLQNRKQTLQPNHRSIGNSYEALASYYAQIKDYNNEQLYAKKFLQLILNNKSPSSIDLANAYQKMGQSYSHLGDDQQGLAFLDKAWTAFFADISNTSQSSVTQQQFDNQVERSLNNPLIYYNILSGKARILWQTYKNTQDASYLFPALISHRQTTDFIDQLRFSYAEHASKQLLLERVYQDYENAIAVCYELYVKNNNVRFLQEAFTFAEKSKSVLLLESVNTTQAENFSGIPDSLLEQEKELQADIVNVEQRKFLTLQEGKPTEETQAKIVDFNEQLFDLKQAQAALVQQFENNYKKYYTLKYDATTSSASTIQRLLKPAQTMVAYFLGDSSLFAFVISPSDLQFLKLEKNIPIKDLVQDVLNGTYNYQLENDLNSQYVSAAYALYQKLWKDVIPASAKEIIIIPNGELGILPFEVLLKKLPQEKKYFSTYDYLIKDYQISYNYSATLFEKLTDSITIDQEYNFLAFAPTFNPATNIALAGQAQRGLDQLKYNKTEVESIEQLLNIDKKVFFEEEATKANFLKYASNYSILHLATHGIVNDKFGDYSYLAFAESPNQDNFENNLYVKDLYNLSLHADMVVLSACETGIGELKKGEGIISLARGFFYAGAKSLVTTLWKVSDKSSAKIIQQFYANLNQQMPKDAALRQAKLTYIHNHPDKLAHPFYWAAYIPVGNMDALHLPSVYPVRLIAFIVLIFAMLFTFYFIKKRV